MVRDCVRFFSAALSREHLNRIRFSLPPTPALLLTIALPNLAEPSVALSIILYSVAIKCVLFFFFACSAFHATASASHSLPRLKACKLSQAAVVTSESSQGE